MNKYKLYALIFLGFALFFGLSALGFYKLSWQVSVIVLGIEIVMFMIMRKN